MSQEKSKINHHKVMMEAEARGLLPKYNELVFHTFKTIEQVCEELNIPIELVTDTPHAIVLEKWKHFIDSVNSNPQVVFQVLQSRERKAEGIELDMIKSIMPELSHVAFLSHKVVENKHIDDNGPRFTLLTELPPNDLPTGLYYFARTSNVEVVSEMIASVLRKAGRLSGWLTTRDYSAKDLQVEPMTRRAVDSLYEANINPIDVKSNTPVILSHFCSDGTDLHRIIPLFKTLRAIRKIGAGITYQYAMREVLDILHQQLQDKAMWRTENEVIEIFMDMKNNSMNERVVTIREGMNSINIDILPHVINLIFALYGENALD